MKKIFVFICFIISLICIQFINVNASTDLDLILNYDITIDANDDATLEMHYYIKWKVLDSSSEGPLTWVKIGIPNKYISNLKSNVNNVKKIKYYSDNGSYVAVYFNKNYYGGDVVDIDFTFHQDRIFTSENEIIEFRFKPGWFPSILVKSYSISWSKKIGTPIYSNYESETEDYYIWSGSFTYNETTNVDVKYQKSVFPNANYDKQYSSNYKTFFNDILPIILFIAVIVAIIVACIIIRQRNYGGYYAYRGFYGARHYYHPWLFGRRGYTKDGDKVSPPPSVNNGSSGGHCASGGGCACACACACAGGGRAGCARKDFTSTRKLINEEQNEK